MGDFERSIERAQWALDQSGGDLLEAVTRAAFRIPLMNVFVETWPGLVTRSCPKREAHDLRTQQRQAPSKREV